MKNLFKLDWIILTAVALLLLVGLLALYSLSFDGNSLNLTNFKKQLISLAIGMGALFFFAFYDYRAFNSNSTRLYFGVLFILFAVVMWGKTVRGTTGWIGLGTFHFQPVELAKLILIIFLASFLSKKKTQLNVPVRIIASVVLTFIPVFLILKQPDFGSSAIVVGVWGAMLLVSGIDKKSMAALFLMGLLVSTSGWFLLRDYQKERLVNFVKPYNDPKGSGYNVIQSMVAVGSGGITGKGLGHGSQSQLNFLPEKHTDFIFAVIAEELGFIGSIVIFLLFGALFYRMKEIAGKARDNFGYLLSTGIMVMFFLQMLINIGMNIGVMPVTGVPLPFLSYGGSSLVIVLASVGILESVHLRGMKKGVDLG